MFDLKCVPPATARRATQEAPKYTGPISAADGVIACGVEADPTTLVATASTRGIWERAKETDAKIAVVPASRARAGACACHPKSAESGEPPRGALLIHRSAVGRAAQAFSHDSLWVVSIAASQRSATEVPPLAVRDTSEPSDARLCLPPVTPRTQTLR